MSNKVTTHFYHIAGLGATVIDAAYAEAEYYSTIPVCLKQGYLDSNEICASGGVELRAKDGVYCNVNKSFEVKTGVECDITSSKNAVKLAIKGSFDELHKTGWKTSRVSCDIRKDG